jgi:Skp family chaperone for outer membrane proteins
MRLVHVVFVAAIVLLMPNLACNQGEIKVESTGAGEPSVAFINQEKVFIESEAGLRGMELLRDLSLELQAELEALQKAEKDESLTAEERAAKSQALQEKLVESRSAVTEEQQRIVAVLEENFTATLEAFRVEKGIAAILPLEMALTYAPEADVTKDIIEAMNARNIDLKAAPATGEDGEKQEQGG